MARPRAKALTQRELEVMQVYWSRGEATIAEVRDELASAGLERAHTTIATLVKILTEKGYLKCVRAERPTRHKPLKSYEDVSGKLLDDVLDRVFLGSTERLLVRLLERRELGERERKALERILKEHTS